MSNIQEVDRKDFYQPATPPLERRAYQAAHQIVDSDFRASHLACRGTRRSRMIDAIAQIIMEACEPGGEHVEPKLQGIRLDRRIS